MYDGCKPCDTSIGPNHHFSADFGERLIDARRYQRIVHRLSYLTLIRPNNAYTVTLISQFGHAPTIVHLEGLPRVLCYLKRTSGIGLLSTKQVRLRVEA